MRSIRSFRRLAGLAVLLCAPCLPAQAIDRIELELGSVSVATVTGREVRAELTLSEDGAAGVALRLAHLDAGRVAGAFTEVTLACGRLIVSEPRFACADARARARGGPTGALDLRGRAEFRGDEGTLTLDVAGLAVAGGTIALDARLGRGAWTVDSELRGLRAGALRRLTARWFELPAGTSAEATVSGRVRASGGKTTRASFDLATPDLTFSNADGTIVAENLDARLAGTWSALRTGAVFEATLSSTGGQALAGPVLLDFGSHPLRLAAEGALREGTLALSDATLLLPGLLDAKVQAEIAVRPAFTVRSAHVALGSLAFPAAYASFMQLALAGTDFGTLKTSGSVSGSAHIADNAIVRLDASLADLDLEDAKGKFSMQDVRGAVHWDRDGSAQVAPSVLQWSRGAAYGLAGDAARLDFRTRGLGFELTRPARLPIFDGALRIRTLAARDLGKAQAEVQFDAVIEPISMPLLSRAFGWPELSGRLSGTIPGLTYRNRVLSVRGDLQAQVFDGTIVGRNFRLQDPLGPWPRLFADITARSLDLELVTRTFPIGSITGRLDTDIDRLELFDWSPVAFDARLYTTPNDPSPHRISQKAITSISSIGGGGSSVTRALQSGVLRFFDEFNYDRIGITCRLRNEVCLMGGIDRGGVGYYLVKGRSLPRIDIIGSTGRVDWPQLLARIAAAMRSSGGVEVR